jgi:hypothetical protein
VTRLSLGAIPIHFCGKGFNHVIKKVVGKGEIEGIYHVLLTWQHTTTLVYFAIC